jgi:FtsP/CotA-like multicopper oxidase with cupredoxin domain
VSADHRTLSRRGFLVLTAGTAMAGLPACGNWLTHCHNIYHGEAGMMTVMSYEA